MKKSKAEAIKILCLYYGQEINVEYTEYFYSFLNGIEIIQPKILERLEGGFIKSFRFTGLRGVDEMTEEEDEYLLKLRRTLPLESRSDVWKARAIEVDYLRSIGIDVTGEYKDVTIEIEN